MRNYLKHHWWEILICLLVAGLAALFLSGCGPRGLVPPGPPSLPGPAGILNRLALGVTAIAGVAIVLAGVAAWFIPNKWLCGKIAIAAIGAIVCCQALFWLSAHLVLCSVVCLCGLLVCGALYAYANRKDLERRLNLDLNRDGKIG